MSHRSVSLDFIRLFSVCVLITLGGTACGGDGNTQDDPANQDAGSRWSDTGDYSYDLSENGCDTGNQNFTSQRDYCLGLENDALNDDCALDLRAASYAQDCGDDFQENNAPVVVDEPGPDPQPAPIPVVTGNPNPAPYPYPTPEPSPSNELMSFPVVRDLNAVGVTVNVQAPGYDIPGLPVVTDYLPAFWDTLYSVEYQLIARKSFFTTLTIATYTAYSPLVNELTLDASMSASDLNQFFTLFDRLEKLQRTSGVSIDTLILLDNSKPASFTALATKITTLEKIIPTLIPAVKKVEFASSNYSDFDVDQRQLTVGGDTYAADLAHYSAELNGAQPFFKMLDELSITTENTPLGFDKQLTSFNAATAMLLAKKDSLTVLAKSGTLSTLSFSDVTYYYPSTKVLSVPTSGTSVCVYPQILDALAWQSNFSKDTKIQFQYMSDNLDAPFVQASQHLEQVADLVKSKLPTIQQIMFGQTSKLLYESLVVGSNDSVDDLKKVILSAK